MHIYFCPLELGQKHAQRNVGVRYNFHDQNEHLVSTHLNGKSELRAVMWRIVILRQGDRVVTSHPPESVRWQKPFTAYKTLQIKQQQCHAPAHTITWLKHMIYWGVLIE